nr:HDOD domain-containing protein [Candidatus Krumholzibacteria bacterium]
MNTKTPDNSSLACPVDLDQVLAGIEELPSIPETLLEILKVLDDPDSGPSDLAAVVRLDAPLMAKILRLANSPYYNPRADIHDINRCVAVLGYRTVRQVAICVSVATSLVSAVARTNGRLDYHELWKHSVVTGAVAKYLGQLAKHPDPELLFSAGLLHDLGKFVLELHAPEVYDQIILNRSQSGRPLVEMEREAFGFDHAHIGSAFARSWRFPPVFFDCFRDHHEQKVGTATPGSAEQVTALVSLADYLANTMEPSRSDLGFDPRPLDSGQLHHHANLSVSTVEDHLSGIREAIQLSTAFLDLS